MRTTDVGRFGIERTPVVLFDFDGTLADTGAAVMRIARAVLRDAGIEAAEADLRKMIGPPLVAGFRDNFGVSEAQAGELTAAYRALFAREVRPADYPPIPGAPELLDALERQGRRMAVATSRKETSACEMIGELGWSERFACVMGMDEPVRLTKADSIRAALAFLGAEPADAVMVGDRANDIEGAHEVGVPCIAVHTGAALPGEHDAAEVACADMAEVASALGVALTPARAMPDAPAVPLR